MLDKNGQVKKQITLGSYKLNDLDKAKKDLMTALKNTALFAEEKDTGILVFKFQTEPDLEILDEIQRTKLPTSGTAAGQMSVDDIKILNYLLDLATKSLADAGSFEQIIEDEFNSSSALYRFTSSFGDETQQLIEMLDETEYIKKLDKEYQDKINNLPGRERFEGSLIKRIPNKSGGIIDREEEKLFEKFLELRSYYIGKQLLETKRDSVKRGSIVDSILIPKEFIATMMNMINTLYLKSILVIYPTSLFIREWVEWSLCNQKTQEQRKKFFFESIIGMNLFAAVALNAALLYNGFYNYNLAELQSGAVTSVAAAIWSNLLWQTIPTILQTADYFEFIFDFSTPLFFIAGADAAGFLPFIIQFG